MDAHQEGIVVLVNKPDHLLNPAVDFCPDQSGKPSYPMVDVNNKIAGMQLVQLLQGDGSALFPACFQVKAVVSFKNLVVGIKAGQQIVLDEALMEGENNRGELQPETGIMENSL